MKSSKLWLDAISQNAWDTGMNQLSPYNHYYCTFASTLIVHSQMLIKIISLFIYNRCWAWNVSDLCHLHEADPGSRQAWYDHTPFQQHCQPDLRHHDVQHCVLGPERNWADQDSNCRHTPVQWTRKLRPYIHMVSEFILIISANQLLSKMVDASWQVMEALGINKWNYRAGGRNICSDVTIKLELHHCPHQLYLCVYTVYQCLYSGPHHLLCVLPKKLYLVVCMSLQDATVIWEH